MYVVWVMFRTRYVHALVFFLLHWLACAIESGVSLPSLPPPPSFHMRARLSSQR
jgi:hypothetical protein